MAKLSQLRVKAEELRIDKYPRMRKEELETEIQKKNKRLAKPAPKRWLRQSPLSGTPQPTVGQQGLSPQSNVDQLPR